MADDIEDIKLSFANSGVSEEAISAIDKFLEAVIDSGALSIEKLSKLAEDIQTYELGAGFSEIIVEAAKQPAGVFMVLLNIRKHLTSEKYLDWGEICLDDMKPKQFGSGGLCIQTNAPEVLMMEDPKDKSWVAGVSSKELRILTEDMNRDSDRGEGWKL